MSYMLANLHMHLPSPQEGTGAMIAKLREFALGALFGAALATLVAIHVHQQLEPVVEPEAGMMLTEPVDESAQRDLNHSITPSTILGPAITNR